MCRPKDRRKTNLDCFMYDPRVKDLVAEATPEEYAEVQAAAEERLLLGGRSVTNDAAGLGGTGPDWL